MPVTLIERIENSKKGVALALAIVIVVIVVAFYVAYQVHKDDALLAPELLYRYVPGTSTRAPSVHIWGDVYNWGDSSGSGTLKIVISDDEGHVLRDSFRVGPVPPHDGVSIDKFYDWNYVYDLIEHPIAPVEVSVDI